LAYISSGVEDEDRTLFTRYGAMWAIGAGVGYQFNDRRSLAVDLTYMDLGDGEFEVSTAPVFDGIQGEYTKHYALVLGISITF